MSKERHWSDVPSDVSAGCCDACDVSLDVAEESRIIPGMCEGCAEREIELDKAEEHERELAAAAKRADIIKVGADGKPHPLFDDILRQWQEAQAWVAECKGRMPARQWPNREEGR